MKRLTNEDLILELKVFRKYELEADKQKSIIRKLEHLEKENQKLRVSRYLNPVLSIIVLLVFLGSATFFAINENEVPLDKLTGLFMFDRSGESYKMRSGEDFTIRKRSDGTAVFKAGDKQVGGIEPLNEDEMYKSLSKQNTFKNEDVEGYRYQAKVTLDHQKMLEYTQIVHYYFQSPESKLNYHVYFYTPFFTEQSADVFAKSFKIYKYGKEIHSKTKH
ncbi:hypothetical protein [Bacillus sp. NEB1478]|uniref:hypothetical protein n=1 Tax=Bacillus sp. NEB1478 TaxID=3073816 RepID=UPI0028731F57|nr:hypothetical protein [Bacillus sp. NEB1478]WNB90904.1 hypothetical protein RGB74_13410 [Bacillus sp. NEB1478]